MGCRAFGSDGPLLDVEAVRDRPEPFKWQPPPHSVPGAADGLRACWLLTHAWPVSSGPRSIGGGLRTCGQSVRPSTPHLATSDRSWILNPGLATYRCPQV